MTTSVKKSTENLKAKRNKFSLTKLTFDRNEHGEISKVKYNGKPIRLFRSCSRNVYKLGEYIIKIEDDATSRHHQTKTEATAYTKIRKEDKKYFPKLITKNIKRGVIVQEFVQMIELAEYRAESAPERRIAKELVKRYKLHKDVRVSKYSNWNWGIRKSNGLPVLYDLGY